MKGSAITPDSERRVEGSNLDAQNLRLIPVKMESARLSSGITNMVPWWQKESETEQSERTRPKALNNHWQPIHISKQTNQSHNLYPNSADKSNELPQG